MRKVDEIDYGAAEDPIEEVPQCPSENEPYGNRGAAPSHLRPEQQQDHDDCRGQEDQHEGRNVARQAKGNPAVRGPLQRDEREDLDALPWLHLGDNQGLAGLVAYDYEQGDDENSRR